MAAGDVLLDADGNAILDDDGNVKLSDGVGDGCCCGGLAQLIYCDNRVGSGFGLRPQDTPPFVGGGDVVNYRGTCYIIGGVVAGLFPTDQAATHVPTGCADPACAASEPCDECRQGTTPKRVTVTFRNVTVCHDCISCYLPNNALSHSASGELNGTYDLPQSSGSPITFFTPPLASPCAWGKAFGGITSSVWNRPNCTLPPKDEDPLAAKTVDSSMLVIVQRAGGEISVQARMNSYAGDFFVGSAPSPSNCSVAVTLINGINADCGSNCGHSGGGQATVTVG